MVDVRYLLSALQASTGSTPTWAPSLTPWRFSATWRQERLVSTRASPRCPRRTGGPARARTANTSGSERPWTEDSTWVPHSIFQTFWMNWTPLTPKLTSQLGFLSTSTVQLRSGGPRRCCSQRPADLLEASFHWGLPEPHIPLQEQHRLHGPEHRQPEEGLAAPGTQRRGDPPGGKQSLHIQCVGGWMQGERQHLQRKKKHFNHYYDVSPHGNVTNTSINAHRNTQTDGARLSLSTEHRRPLVCQS